jgi:hypothetical protein
VSSTEQATSTIEDSAIAFTKVARSLFLADGVEDSLTRAVDLSVVTVEACEFAGAFLLEGDEVTTRACTDPVVAEVDALQLRAGEGPCLDAIAHKLTFYAGELGTDLSPSPRCLALTHHAMPPDEFRADPTIDCGYVLILSS